MTQQEALDILKLGHNVYLTGQAGSGKTYVLNQYIHYLRERDIEVGITASTGIAATHMNGVTIHSWCGIGIRDTLSDAEIDALEQKQYLWSRFKKTKVLIIDEVSMLHGDNLDLIDRVCRSFKRTNEPFGGMQVILCGDFFQLPPIVRGSDEVRFVFHSESWRDMGLKICYLEEQFRQTDAVFTSILNKIRADEVDEEVIELLKTQQGKELSSSVRPTKLYTHNIDVDAVNEWHLKQIPGSPKTFTMQGRGNPHLVDMLKRSCLAYSELSLKPGAQVMFVKNNFDRGYVNGTLGVVTNFDTDGTPLVRVLSGKIIPAVAQNWAIEEDGKVKAEISQIPLRLAWAITVHKSQGMSLDAAEIDLSKSFVAGQGYVALSRVRTLAGLSLSGFNQTALQIDPNVFEYDKELRSESSRSRDYIAKIPKEEKIKRQTDFIMQSGGSLEPKKVESYLKKEKLPKISTYEATRKLVDEEMTIKEIAKKRSMTEGTVLAHIEKLVEEGDIDPQFDLEYLMPDKKAFEKIKKVCEELLEKSGEIKLTPARELLRNTYSFDDIRLVRMFVSGNKKGQ